MRPLNSRTMPRNALPLHNGELLSHLPVETPVPVSRRLRAAILTPTLMMGGAERWLISLARCCDQRQVEWTGTALSLGAIVHPDLCREMAAYMPVYAGPEAGPSPCPDAI